MFVHLVALVAALSLPTHPDTGGVVRDSMTPLVDLAPTLAHLSLLPPPALPGSPPPIILEGSSLAPGILAADSGRRPKAVHYSDMYYTRLKVHQIASYLTVPLFVAQYLSGQALWNNPDSHGLARDAHGPLAASVAGLFAVNTVTGVWNMWDARKDPNGRTRRWVHGISMLVADAGFVVVGATAPDDDEGGGSHSSGARTHRNVAIGSMGLALSSYLMMLIWKD